MKDKIYKYKIFRYQGGASGRWNVVRNCVSALVALTLMAGCSNDLTPENPADIAQEESYNGLEKISFTVPRASYGINAYTRAVDTGKEGALSNMYVLAVKTKVLEFDDYGQITGVTPVTGDPDVQVFALRMQDLGVNQPYQEFNVELYPAVYRFYLLANCNMYLMRFGSIANITKESQLKDLYLHFMESVPLQVEHLPMACFPTEIKLSPDGEPVGEDHQDITVFKTKYIDAFGNVQTTGATNSPIYADMGFLCSKVRYTIMYNNTPGGCSVRFGNTYSIRFNVDANTYTTASNLRNKTYLYRDHSWVNETTDPDTGLTSTVDDLDSPFIKTANPYEAYDDEGNPYTKDDAFWQIELNRCWFGEGAPYNENYPTKPSDTLELWPKTKNEWEAETKQRIWQGVCYLPENDDPRVAHTLLAFPYAIDETDSEGVLHKGNFDPQNFKVIWLFGNNTNETHYPGGPGEGDSYGGTANGDGYSHGLKRGMMYDVVAKVKTPDVDEFEVTVYVQAKPWEYSNMESEW